MLRKKQHGFTLIEVLVVVIMVGILAFTALPTYQAHVQKARRADAIAQLLDYQGRFERCYNRVFSYATCNDTILAEALNYPSTSNTWYVIAAETTATTYTLSATVNDEGLQDGDQQVGVSCAVLTLNETGAAAPTECF